MIGVLGGADIGLWSSVPFGTAGKGRNKASPIGYSNGHRQRISARIAVIESRRKYGRMATDEVSLMS